ncbi:hypothetical protein [Methanolobus psychrotolerans]|uniref:hypothetical protein n=1 Tax=Methanolobus psychrotolerans TaxID=1874706 RepID=UPI0013EDB8FB|nr:hypothetical protein [Methanolobus psychrotolerans]
MPVPYSGQLEEQIEKYDLRYDDQIGLFQEQKFADDVQEPEDYLTTVQRILAEVD